MRKSLERLGKEVSEFQSRLHNIHHSTKIAKLNSYYDRATHKITKYILNAGHGEPKREADMAKEAMKTVINEEHAREVLHEINQAKN